MEQNSWQVGSQHGFLTNPDPLVNLTECNDLLALLPQADLYALEDIATHLPELLEGAQIRYILERLPAYDFAALSQQANLDFRIVERLMLLYSLLANAYIYTPDYPTLQRIPAGLAQPLYQISQMIERPPILTYASYALNNWRRIDPQGEIALGNIELLQPFRGGRDESGFILVHIDIEARAAQALKGIQTGWQAAENEDHQELAHALQDVNEGLWAMMRTFGKMPEYCDPDVYYWKVRPYMFGFNDITYDGVSAFNSQPQSFRGQSGAQSSVVPALVAGLGMEHQQSELTHHLDIMRQYMPKPHREFISAMKQSPIRETIIRLDDSLLKDAYNNALDALIKFRRLHLHFAVKYIYEKVENPTGTGGTDFMKWLDHLIDESRMMLLA